jgi:glycosyltransferase involved in cell wall biosynthesis
MVGNLLISQSIIPFYRVSFFNILFSSLHNSRIIAGDEDGSTNTSPAHNLLNDEIIKTTNIFYFKNSFWRQKGLFKHSLNYESIVITFSLRNLDMYWLLILKILGLKKVYLWGHIQGKKDISSIRFFFASLATNFIFYTRTDSILASDSIFFARKRLFYLGNSCVSSNYCQERKKEIAENYSLTKRRGLIYSGRLVKEKGVFDVVKIFLDSCALGINGFDYFYIIGDGPLYSSIYELINVHSCGSRVKLLGKITYDEALSSYYKKCSASISHGYVGLNSIQSFANGVPMFILNGPLHSPEIESCDAGLNSVFYNDESQLKTLFQSWNENMKFVFSPMNIINNISHNYTFESMSDNFLNALN